jgi:hypothetical protein
MKVSLDIDHPGSPAAAVQDPTVPGAKPPEAPDKTPEEPAATPKYQSIAVRKSQPDDAAQTPPRVGYPTPEAAAARLKELGHDVSDMEDHEDAYVFHQKLAPECKDAGEPDVEDIEEGMKGIGCGKAAVAEQPETAVPAKNPYEDAPPQGTKGSKAKKPTKKDDEATGGERALVASGEAGQPPRVPAGAQFLKAYSDLHSQGCAIHDEHKGLIDNPPITAAHGEWSDADADRGEDIKGITADLYPEVIFPEDDDGSLGDGDDDLPDDAQAKDAADDAAMPGEMAMADPPRVDTKDAADADEMPYGAQYLAKVAGHVDAGQAMLNAGVTKQENPAVRDFADDEISRLEDRKSECKDLMAEHYPDHVDKVFPPDAEQPSPDEGAAVGADEGAGEGAGEKRAAAPTTKVMSPTESVLTELANNVNALVKGLGGKHAAGAPIVRDDQVDSALEAELARLLANDAAQKKQIADAAITLRRLENKLRQRMGVDGKKAHDCHCGGSCGACQARTYFQTKDMGVNDEAAGGALVPAPETPADKPKNKFKCSCGKAFEADGEESACPDCKSLCKMLPALEAEPALDAAAKEYRLYCTLNGQKRLLIPGTDTKWNMKDFRIEDQHGNVYDGRYWQDRRPADAALAELTQA